MITAFFCLSLRRAERYFERNRTAKLITAFFFLLLVVGLATGIYFFFKAGFSFIAGYPFFRDAVTLYIYELFLLIVFMLAFTSALIVSVFALFNKSDQDILMASPRFGTVPSLVFVKSFLASLWPFIVLAFPALLAVRNTTGLAAGAFLLSLVSLALFLAMAVIFAMALVLGISWLLDAMRKAGGCPLLSMKNLLLSIAAVFLVALAFGFVRLRGIDFGSFFEATSLDSASASITSVADRFSVFPSHPAAMELFDAGKGDTAGALASTFYLLVLSVAGFILMYIFSKRHLRFWQILQEGNFQADSKQSRRKSPGTGLMLKARSPTGAIFAKEAIAFFRNGRGLAWSCFLLAIWLVQSSLNVVLRHQVGRGGIDPNVIPIAIGALQFAIAIYFVDMFILRFVFPSLSIEKKTAWLVGSAPVDLGKVFLTKLLFFVPFGVALGIVFAGLNVAIIGSILPLSLFLVLLLILAISTLTVFALGLGALFPNFETDDPEVITTSLPGLAFVFSSLAYGALGTISIYRLFLGQGTSLLWLFVAVSVAIIAFFLYIPHKSLQKIEF
ncbi:MAG: hypothetical protein ABSF56_00250 [Minisyncoccia bacterium]|jgi:ABC-2 type transport system permease protein